MMILLVESIHDEGLLEYYQGNLSQLSDFQCYVDASFAGDVDTKSSTTGYIFKICG